MTLLEFLEHLAKHKNIPHSSVICFAGREYPLLFFSQLFSFLKKNNVMVEGVSVEEADMALLKAQLSTISFSGPVVYWFKDIQLLSAKKQQEWITYFSSYRGPHAIFFFSSEEQYMSPLRNVPQVTVISLPNELSLQDVSMIRFLINNKSEKQTTPIDAGLYVQVMSLDTICLLSHYELVVGRNWNLFFKEWAPYIIEPTSSLFLLSQYFFGKKSHLFFTQWSQMHDIYVPMFWPTFWADQLWRAYIYCDFMQQRNYIEARKAQYKLPYSLIKRDWSSLKLQELKNAHNYLFELDYRLKNGASFAAIELFFHRFFEDKFKAQARQK